MPLRAERVRRCVGGISEIQEIHIEGLRVQDRRGDIREISVAEMWRIVRIEMRMKNYTVESRFTKRGELATTSRAVKAAVDSPQ